MRKKDRSVTRADTRSSTGRHADALFRSKHALFVWPGRSRRRHGFSSRRDAKLFVVRLSPLDCNAPMCLRRWWCGRVDTEQASPNIRACVIGRGRRATHSRVSRLRLNALPFLNFRPQFSQLSQPPRRPAGHTLRPIPHGGIPYGDCPVGHSLASDRWGRFCVTTCSVMLENARPA